MLILGYLKSIHKQNHPIKRIESYTISIYWFKKLKFKIKSNFTSSTKSPIAAVPKASPALFTKISTS